VNLDYNLQVFFFIAFGDVEGLAGEPVIDYIAVAVSHVEQIMLAIEAEAKRLGLVL
jgi:hypothetical protein